MSLRRKSKVGVGLFWIFVGLVGTFLPGGERPADASEAIGFYGVGIAAILFGLWLMFRGLLKRPE
jgi:ABC-type uncharacterized transport system permease subunit